MRTTGSMTKRLDGAGEVYRWERSHPSWHQHTSFIVLQGLEVMIGEQYSASKFSKTYSCHPASFVKGCFHEIIEEEYGAETLKEVLKAVRKRGFGLEIAPTLPPFDFEREGGSKFVFPSMNRRQDPPELRPLRGGTTSPVLDALNPFIIKAAVGLEAPSVASSSPSPAVVTPASIVIVDGPIPNTSSVEVTLEGAHSISLGLVTTLQSLLGLPGKKVRHLLGNLPLQIKSSCTLKEAKEIKRQFIQLGAAVKLRAGIPKSVAAKKSAPETSKGKANYAVRLRGLGRRRASVMRILANQMGGTNSARNLLKKMPGLVAKNLFKSKAEALWQQLNKAGAKVELIEL